eukprot:gene26105-31523_t
MASQPEGFQDAKSYLTYLETQAKLPQGFSVSTTKLTFEPYEVANKKLPMTLTLIVLDEPSPSFATVYTKNKFCGGPIYVGKAHASQSPAIQAIIVNNKISNVCPNGLSDWGFGDSETLCKEVARLFLNKQNEDLDILKKRVIPSSTGIIGWRLPLPTMLKALPELSKNLQRDSMLPAAQGIMTTDRYPKLRSYTSSNPSAPFKIVAIAKGAGMIEPNLATMLCYITTDLAIDKDTLQDAVRRAVDKAFNRVSVDGDQSTSDSVVAISSNKIKGSAASVQEFLQQLPVLLTSLAEDLVRNGEGVQHVIRVRVRGVKSEKLATSIGKGIVNSNLVKCAVGGNDPNVGRIVGAIGSVLSKLSSREVHSDQQDSRPTPLPPSTLAFDNLGGGEEVLDLRKLTLTMGGGGPAGGGEVIFQKGRFDLNGDREDILFRYMKDCQLFDAGLPEGDRTYPPHFKCVELGVDFGGQVGEEGVVVVGGDLTKEYVEVNADYRS